MKVSESNKALQPTAGRRDDQLEFMKHTVKGFFKGPKVDPVAVAARDAFNAASDAYDTAFHAIEAYTNRANHRYAILGARRELYKAPLDDPYAADAYDKTVADYTDSADFEPYTE